MVNLKRFRTSLSSLGVFLLLVGCSHHDSIKRDGNTSYATLTRRVDATKDLVKDKINIVYVHADW